MTDQDAATAHRNAASAHRNAARLTRISTKAAEAAAACDGPEDEAAQEAEILAQQVAQEASTRAAIASEDARAADGAGLLARLARLAEEEANAAADQPQGTEDAAMANEVVAWLHNHIAAAHQEEHDDAQG